MQHPPSGAAPALETEDMTVPAGPGLDIHVRNKRPAGLDRFSPDRTLVFVHGATYPASTAFDLQVHGQSWMDFLAARGFDVYLLDLPGYGRSSRPAAMDQPAEDNPPLTDTAEARRCYAAVVDMVLRRRQLSRLNAMGWSWGTTIAGGFAAEQPEKVERLVLFAPLWLQDPPPAGSETGKLGAYRTVTPDEARARWLNGVPEAKQAELIPPGVFERWQRATWATDPKANGDPALLRAPNGVVQDRNRFWTAGKPTYDPGRITAPTLVVLGEWDRDTPPSLAQALFPLLTGAAWKQYVLIGEATHTVLLEKNRMQLFHAVQSFLEQPGPG